MAGERDDGVAERCSPSKARAAPDSATDSHNGAHFGAIIVVAGLLRE